MREEVKAATIESFSYTLLFSYKSSLDLKKKERKKRRKMIAWFTRRYKEKENRFWIEENENVRLLDKTDRNRAYDEWMHEDKRNQLMKKKT